MLGSAKKSDGTWLELVQVHASLATKCYTVESKQVRRAQTRQTTFSGTKSGHRQD